MPQDDRPAFIRVTHRWTWAEWRAAARFRLGRFGGGARVAPGLYALGSPGEDSPVIVTASYRLTFDVLRRDLSGTDAWVLALDTAGLDVASAAAVGRFSTEELVARVQASRVHRVVRHRRLVLPLRAASVVDAAVVQRNTGFQVLLGPERSSDLGPFLAGAGPAPRRFGVRDALPLTPAELGRSLLLFPGFAFVVLLYTGLGADGVSISRALAGSWPLVVMGLASTVGASVLAPLLSAAIPWIPLWAAGLAVGLGAEAALLRGARLGATMDGWLSGACWLFFPAAGAAIAARFRRAMPVTASARRDLPPAVLRAGAALIAMLVLAALVLSKVRHPG